MDIMRGSGRKAEGRGSGGGSRTKKALLKDQLELVKVKTGEGRSRYSIRPLDSTLSFEKGSFMVVRAIQLLASANRDTVMVGLAGPSGSGKTAFSAKIQKFIPDSIVLSMDMYNDGSKVIDGNFDDPRITDFDTLLANIADLRAGRPTDVPIYDFKESRRVGTRRVEVGDSRVVILEGIYALSSRVRRFLDLRVSITGGVHFDLVKRVLRDIDRSGQAAEEIIAQVSETVYPMYKAFIEPDLQAAHLRVHNAFNPFSGFMSPTFILKSAKPVAADAIHALLAQGGAPVVEESTEAYDIYLLPPNEDAESCTSWLRMRYRDGRYSLMFEEWVVDGAVIISPRVTFEVPVRILGGLMALGYDVGTIMHRHTTSLSDGRVTVKLDRIEGMGRTYVQVQSKERLLTQQVGQRLGLEGSYVPHSYIELVQMENLTTSFQTVTEDLKRRFKVSGEPLEASMLSPSASFGSSPPLGLSADGAGFRRTLGFELSGYQPGNALQLLSTSAPVSRSQPGMSSAGSRMSLPPPPHVVAAGGGGAAPPGAAPRGDGLLSQQMAADRDREGGVGTDVPGSGTTNGPLLAASAPIPFGSRTDLTGAGEAAGGLSRRRTPALEEGSASSSSASSSGNGSRQAAPGEGRRTFQQGQQHKGSSGRSSGAGEPVAGVAPAPLGRAASGALLEDKLASLLDSQTLLSRQLEQVALQLRLLREAGGSVSGGATPKAAEAWHDARRPQPPAAPGPVMPWEAGAGTGGGYATATVAAWPTVAAAFGSAMLGAALGSALVLGLARGSR